MTFGLFINLIGKVMQNDALRLMRVFHDMSQTNLADKLGISKSYLSEIEKGEKKKVTLDLLERYSQVFNIPVSSLMFFAEQVDQGNYEKVRSSVAGKVLKMLDWIATTQDVDKP
jgi:transcriptional regulator with XRE-family HTH domain